MMLRNYNTPDLLSERLNSPWGNWGEHHSSFCTLTFTPLLGLSITQFIRKSSFLALWERDFTFNHIKLNDLHGLQHLTVNIADSNDNNYEFHRLSLITDLTINCQTK